MLLDVLETATAWEKLHDPSVSGTLDAEGMLEACKAAGYSEEVAQKAAAKRGLARMRLELPP